MIDVGVFYIESNGKDMLVRTHDVIQFDTISDALDYIYRREDDITDTNNGYYTFRIYPNRPKFEDCSVEPAINPRMNMATPDTVSHMTH